MAGISRRELVEAARRARSGGRLPTMDEVAIAAGVSRATLYRLIGSRTALLSEVDLEPPRSVPTRVLQAAEQLVERRGLTGLSMDEVAGAAGVSRATLYRLFPGKAGLISELVRVYSPFQELAATVAAMADRSPAEMMPVVAHTMARSLLGRSRVVLVVMSELGGSDADTMPSVDVPGVPELLRYFDHQMTAGRLRRTHPLLAFQSFLWPLIIHLHTRRYPTKSSRGFELPLEDAVDELLGIWLRGLAPPASA
jgi:AcrR family transcriptional regulator